MINKKRKNQSGDGDDGAMKNKPLEDSGSGTDIIAPHKFTRKERRHLKKEMRRMRPLWRRISQQFVKTALIRIPLFIIVCIVVTLFSLKI